MAKLTIEIEENEFALYDVLFRWNGERVDEAENFTSEEAAIEWVMGFIVND